MVTLDQYQTPCLFVQNWRAAKLLILGEVGRVATEIE